MHEGRIRGAQVGSTNASTALPRILDMPLPFSQNWKGKETLSVCARFWSHWKPELHEFSVLLAGQEILALLSTKGMGEVTDGDTVGSALQDNNLSGGLFQTNQ